MLSKYLAAGLKLSRDRINIFDWADVILKRTRLSFVFISLLIFISAFLIRMEVNDQNKMVDLISLTNDQKLILSDINQRILFLSKIVYEKKGSSLIKQVQLDLAKKIKLLKQNHQKIIKIKSIALSLSGFFQSDSNIKKDLLEEMSLIINRVEKISANLTNLSPEILYTIFDPLHGRYIKYLPSEKDFSILYNYNHEVMNAAIRQNSFSSRLHFLLLIFVLCGIWLVWLLVLKPIINNLKEVLLLYHESKKTLEHQVNHDELTGLYNRKYLAKVLDSTADYGDDYFIYFFTLDLDKFKNINDRYGHDAGDSLLKTMSAILKSQREDNEFQFRIGGDELVIVFFSKESIDYAKNKAHVINLSTTYPLTYDNKLINFSVSIGISHQKIKHFNQDDLTRTADHALYFVKNHGGNSYAEYLDLELSSDHYYLELEKELFIAIEQESFEVFYQPVIQLSTKKIVAIEALIRWKHDNLGYLLPGKWLFLAQRNDLLTKMSSILINKVEQHIKLWRIQGISPVQVNINATENIIECDTIIDKLVKSQHDFTSHPTFPIGVEITESIVLDRNLDEIIHRINQLKNHNVNISLDDFGTGYATLSHLIKLPFDTIKIDKSFVINMLDNIDNKKIVDSIIKLSKSLGKETICEGVESLKVSDALFKMKCDYIQGFFYSKPVPFNEISNLLKSKEVFLTREFNHEIYAN